MTKLEMAIEIASALFNKDVDENNWKVKRLVRLKKDVLLDHMALADSINQKRRGDNMAKIVLGKGIVFESIDKALFSSPCGESKAMAQGLCRNVNCDTAVAKHDNRYYITFGHAGFNSDANNKKGYATEANARAAIRNYLKQ